MSMTRLYVAIDGESKVGVVILHYRSTQFAVLVAIHSAMQDVSCSCVVVGVGCDGVQGAHS